MPLNLSQLETAVFNALKKAKETPPPEDPNESDQIQIQILEQLAQDLAAAIDAYVRGGVVGGVSVEVRNSAHVVIGTGQQTGTVSLQ